MARGGDDAAARAAAQDAWGGELNARTCIYCRQQREPSAFNREHVVPEAFGKFEHNLTLTCVCFDCNDYFGRTIELAFNRDSVEAFLRLLRGTKKAKEARDLPLRRLSITLGDGDWSGCCVALKEEDGALVIDLVPQVRFTLRNGDHIFITEDVLADEAQPLPEDIDTKQDVRVISRSLEMDERLTGVLARRGVAFEKKGEGGRPPSMQGLAPIDLRMRFDSAILRCVAKIAFNYTACLAGAAFVLHESFDVARAFIRYATKPPYAVVLPRVRPILADDTPTRRQTEGHLLTVDWASDPRAVVGQVSLFNGPTYAVSLARRYTGVWRDIRSGHHFDVDTRRISPLAAGRWVRLRRVPPPRLVTPW